MIYFDSRNKTFYLETDNTSYIMRILSEGTLSHCYYGKVIARDNMKYYNLFRECAFSPLMTFDEECSSMDTVPQECPTRGRGDYRLPALQVATADGRIINELKYSFHKIQKGKPQFSGMPQFGMDLGKVQTLIIELSDTANQFKVLLYYSVFEKENAIVRRTEVYNTSGSAIFIKNIASMSFDIQGKNLDMITLSGAWARERHIEQYPLHHGISSIESRRGSSSHQLSPFAALADKSITEDTGEVYATALVYSSDFKISAETNQLGSVRFQAGINPETFTWKLAPNESFTSPEAVLVYSDCGLNGMSQSFHTLCNKHLGNCAKLHKNHPIVINSWEAMYFTLNEEKVLKFIDNCKGLGIDTFVLDDGWFGKRNDDTTSLGDWFADKTKFPNGLKVISEACKRNGIRFGLWFEPEMISRNSKLFKEHPDWAIQSKNYSAVESRNQLVLDFSRKEVCDGIYDMISSVISENDISYVKWDMNRNITDNGSDFLESDRQSEHSHRYILGVYYLMDKLTKAFPDVFFEGCSGGGGRNDFGILYYMPQIWTSDDTDAGERLKIQYGTSLVYPPSTMSAHVSACPNHQTQRTTSFKTRGDIAQMCNLGYELDVGKIDDSEREAVNRQIAKHRQLDQMIQEGAFYRLISPFKGESCAWQLVSNDKKKSFVLYANQKGTANPKSLFLKLKGLESDSVYKVLQLGIEISGKTLMNAGIPVVTNTADYSTITFDIVKK